MSTEDNREWNALSSWLFFRNHPSPPGSLISSSQISLSPKKSIEFQETDGTGDLKFILSRRGTKTKKWKFHFPPPPPPPLPLSRRSKSSHLDELALSRGLADFVEIIKIHTRGVSLLKLLKSSGSNYSRLFERLEYSRRLNPPSLPLSLLCFRISKRWLILLDNFL